MNQMVKQLHLEEIGNAYKLQLSVYANDIGAAFPHGKPVVVLDTASDEDLGKAVRALLRTRIRTPRKAKAGEAVTA